MSRRLEPNQILHGDSRELLRTLPEASVDAVVTDPPAGISFMGRTWDDPGTLGVSGGMAMPATTSSRNPSCRNCGGRKRAGEATKACQCETPDWNDLEYRMKDRQAFVDFLQEIMAECYRVLKPGGHAVVWALPRTSHWTAMAVENAGFEIRDCIYHVFGSGFPKSLNVAQAVEKTVTTGKARRPDRDLGRGRISGAGPGSAGNYDAGGRVPLTSDEAKKWEGWGTALKPSTECWWLCRKPIDAQNVAANVLKHGTGALNIDATRIGYKGDADRESAFPGGKVTSRDVTGGGLGAGYKEHERGEFQAEQSSKGRWPANLMLSHSEGCRQVGEAQADAPVLNRWSDGMKPFGDGAGHPYESTGGGTETVPVYKCVPGCPVKAMDEQSGVTGGGTPTLNSEVDRTAISTTSHNPREPNQSDSLANYGDAGGASRYFQTFDNKGRWPSNMVLSHAPGCVRRGTKQVKGGNDPRRSDGTVNHGGEVYGGNISGGSVHASEHAGFSDVRGMETVEDWECAEGCPVAEIDRQGREMGVHPAGSPQPPQEKYEMSEQTPSYGGGFSGPSGMRYGDDGGASRFFQTLEPDVPFFYTAKASRSEKEEGLEDRFTEARRRNTHPTVKPISLMRYLVKMVTPKGGIILDPFAGSGSTLIAALEEGMQFIGIEREAEYIKIAERRVGVVAKRTATVQAERDIFEMMMNLGDEDE